MVVPPLSRLLAQVRVRIRVGVRVRVGVVGLARARVGVGASVMVRVSVTSLLAQAGPRQPSGDLGPAARAELGDELGIVRVRVAEDSETQNREHERPHRYNVTVPRTLQRMLQAMTEEGRKDYLTNRTANCSTSQVLT